MGARGPQKGFRNATKEGAEKPLFSIPVELVELSAADRENPARLDGDALRALAYRRGLSRSAMQDMTDDKIRMQLHYVTNRQYDEEVA